MFRGLFHPEIASESNPRKISLNFSMLEFVFFLLFLVAATTHAFSRAGLESRSLRLSNKLIVCSATSSDDAGRLLYDTATSGDAEKLKTLIAEAKGDGKVLNWRATERYGRTPLVIASYYGKLEAVKILVGARGVDVNLGTDFGATALHFAAHRGHFDVVKLLLAGTYLGGECTHYSEAFS